MDSPRELGVLRARGVLAGARGKLAGARADEIRNRGGVARNRGDLARTRRELARGVSVPGVLYAVAPHAIEIKHVLGAARDINAVARGWGPHLRRVIEDPIVTDILINGGTGVWLDRGTGLERDEALSALLSDAGEVRALAVRLAASAGQRLDDAAPIADGTFSNGTRLHAVLAPLAAEGAAISLRTQRARTFTLAELEAAGTFPAALTPVLTALVERRANVMVAGATGSGKTTLLASLLSCVPATERLIIIEEAAELRPAHPHVLHLQIRRPNVEGHGEITMSQLVRAALRMRPDRIVVGECRGEEVREVLTALNTGHEGGWATIHANSARDVPARLVALGALAGMSAAVVAAQAVAALDAIISIERHGPTRRITHVAILHSRNGELEAPDALTISADGTIRAGPGWATLGPRLGLEGTW